MISGMGSDDGDRNSLGWEKWVLFVLNLHFKILFNLLGFIIYLIKSTFLTVLYSMALFHYYKMISI